MLIVKRTGKYSKNKSKRITYILILNHVLWHVMPYRIVNAYRIEILEDRNNNRGGGGGGRVQQFKNNDSSWIS